MLNRANARLRMGDLAIESGVFKVGATARDAQEMVKRKLDDDDLLGDVTKVIVYVFISVCIYMDIQ
jgi:hypothetical protein